MLAQTLHANPDVVEALYRAMISAFIEAELAELAALEKTQRNNPAR